MAGSKEDAETVTAFFQDMRARGLGDPLLVVSDGAPGISQSPGDLLPTLRAPARARSATGGSQRRPATNTSSRLIVRIGLPAPSCSRCLCPGWSHHTPQSRRPRPNLGTEIFIPVTNLLERLFVEERRRLKIIPNAFGEKPVLKLMFGAMIRVAARWRAVKVTEFERRQAPCRQTGS